MYVQCVKRQCHPYIKYVLCSIPVTVMERNNTSDDLGFAVECGRIIVHDNGRNGDAADRAFQPDGIVIGVRRIIAGVRDKAK